jgi:FKBP-type peptidyl-prolyl cis-trans isomerase FkpA
LSAVFFTNTREESTMLVNPYRRLSCLALALSLAACSRAGDDPAKPINASAKTATPLTNERERASYVVGLDLAKNVMPVKDDVDIEVVVQALREAYAGTPRLDETEADAIRRRFTQRLREQRDIEQRALASKNRDIGAAYLAENARRDGVVTTASGLQYQVMRAATGPHPKAGDTVRVNYIGHLIDGRRFEDTYAIDHPAAFPLAQVMPGLREALQLMPVGAQYRFWLPSALGYGEGGLAGQIEPNTLLVFEVELLEIAGQGP